MFATASVLCLTIAATLAFAQPQPPTPPTPPVGVISSAGGWLGVGTLEVDAKLSLELDLDAPHGVQITTVVPGSPADQAGLKYGDVITGFRGHRVEGVQHFVRLVRETPVGRDAEMEVHTQSGVRKLTAEIAQRRHEEVYARQFVQPQALAAPSFDIDRSRMQLRNRSLGVELETLEGQLARYFGVNSGVLVRSVEDYSGAAQAELQAGDVITSVAARPVDRPNDVRLQIELARGETEVEFQIVRERSARSLQIPVFGFIVSERRSRSLQTPLIHPRERVFPGLSIADPGF